MVLPLNSKGHHFFFFFQCPVIVPLLLFKTYNIFLTFQYLDSNKCYIQCQHSFPFWLTIATTMLPTNLPATQCLKQQSFILTGLQVSWNGSVHVCQTHLGTSGLVWACFSNGDGRNPRYQTYPFKPLQVSALPTTPPNISLARKVTWLSSKLKRKEIHSQSM